jgi:hypothetical protein
VYSQSLKGYKIGDDIKYKKTILKTRIVGITGTLYTSVLSDGRIYKIEFIAGSKTEQMKLRYEDVIRFKNYIEDHFNINMDEILEEDNSEKEFHFSLAANYYPEEKLPYDLIFTLYDPELAKEYRKETVVSSDDYNKKPTNTAP